MRLATITLNSTLDRVIVAPDFRVGTITTRDEVYTMAGGKGVNVARAAHSLGVPVVAAGLVAGKCGEWIGALLTAEGVPHCLIPLPGGESRISTIIVDPRHNTSTVVNDRGPAVPSALWPELCSQLALAVRGSAWVVLAGAGLPGLPDAAYADLCAEVQIDGARVCVDARDRWLAHALSARPHLVKCNRHEAARLMGHPVRSVREAGQAARAWAAQALARVVISLGRDGAVAVKGEQAWHVTAPRVEALYPVGSGDAMMAGLVVALDRGAPLPEAVRYGVAVGTANTLVPGSGRCDLDALPELISRTAVRSL